MELLKAINLLEKRKEELEALEVWADSLESDKPIRGEYWERIVRNIDEVLTDFQEENERLEREIESVAQSLKIQWDEN